jgi:hypothetical protein
MPQGYPPGVFDLKNKLKNHKLWTDESYFSNLLIVVWPYRLVVRT